MLPRGNGQPVERGGGIVPLFPQALHGLDLREMQPAPGLSIASLQLGSGVQSAVPGPATGPRSIFRRRSGNTTAASFPTMAIGTASCGGIVLFAAMIGALLIGLCRAVVPLLHGILDRGRDCLGGRIERRARSRDRAAAGQGGQQRQHRADGRTAPRAVDIEGGGAGGYHDDQKR